MVESGKLSRVSSNQYFKFQDCWISVHGNSRREGWNWNWNSSLCKKFSRLSMSLTPENKELDNSSLSKHIPGGETGIKGQSTNSNGRKRKAIPKGKGKETQFSTVSAKDNKTGRSRERRIRCKKKQVR